MTRIRLAFLVALTIALTAQGANAGSLKPAAGARLLQKTHGCHYSCECGPPRDFGCEQQYHRHLHMLCLPVRCDRRTDCASTPSEGVCRHIAPR
jgi:hypothetical protein